MQILATNLYTDKQLIVNAVIFLQKANIFPTKDFDNFEAIQLQLWSIMKTLFHKASTCRLNAISMHLTSGQHGYSNPNQYAIFDAMHDDDNTSTASTHHTMATTLIPPVGSTIGGTTLGGTQMSPEVASVLAQLSHSQNALMQQMAALSVVPPQQSTHQITIPTGNQFT